MGLNPTAKHLKATVIKRRWRPHAKFRHPSWFFWKASFDHPSVLSHIIARNKFQPFLPLQQLLGAFLFFGTKLMSHEQTFRITANILTFQPYVRKEKKNVSDPYKILSSKFLACLFVCKNFYIGHNFCVVSDGAFIFHTYIPWVEPFSLVPKSSSSVKVKYQGHSFQKSGCCMGICVSQPHLVFIIFLFFTNMIKLENFIRLHGIKWFHFRLKFEWHNVHHKN